MKRPSLLAALPFLALALALAACRGSNDETPAGVRRAPGAQGLDDQALANGFYCSSDVIAEGPVRLQGGAWSATDEEGRQSLELGNPRARGDLDGDGREDAAIILLGSGGGSGVFVDLAIVLDRNGVPVHAASAALGDRVQVHEIRIEKSDVLVDVTQQGPGDPACCPTQNVTRRFHFADGKLTDTAPPPATPAGSDAPAPAPPGSTAAPAAAPAGSGR